MPLYEYKCRSCGKIFEVIQKFSDEPLKVHEACGGDVEKLISRSAFQLKGSGWYATDYAKGNGASKKEDSSPASQAESKTGAESKAGTESKTADKGSSQTKTSEAKTTETKPAPATSTDTK